MLKFAKSVPYLIDPIRSRPYIRDRDKQRARESPPPALPLHCKPWLDGQAAGWTLSYGYLTSVSITGQEDGRLLVKNLEELARETNQPRIIDRFAEDHFGIGSGYTLRTPNGYVTLILPAAGPPEGPIALTGLVETDWYPRQLFLVFRVPDPAVTIRLERGTPLARALVIPRQEDLEPTPLTEVEIEELKAQEAQYLAEEGSTPSRWISATGDSFTHLYKIWSARHRRAKQGRPG